MRRRAWTATALCCLAAAGLALDPEGGAGQYPGGRGPILAENPCHGDLASLLRCPNLRMGRPRDLYFTTARNGALLLHATNDIKSRGEGPLEVRGRRNGPRTMRAFQAIHTTRGGRRLYRTNGSLLFYPIPGQGPYWKFHRAARFELWSIGRDGRRERFLRRGPKLTYCFRDLERTAPSQRSPGSPQYPACSQDRGKRFRTLGTSVGWSDIYPSTYHQNWINVRGLRGCFAFVHRADPANLLYENNERDNVAGRRIWLPPPGGRVRSCRR